MRARRTFVVAIAMLAVLVGCTKGDDGQQVSTGSGDPAGTRWAERFCVAYGEWVTELTGVLDTARALDPAQGPAAAHQTLSQAVASARDATGALVGKIDAAGEPALPNGAVIAVDIIHAFKTAESGFTSALSALQSVNPNDPAILLPGAEGARAGLVNTLVQARNELATALAEPEAQRLSPALAAAPGCDTLFEPPPV